MTLEALAAAFADLRGKVDYQPGERVVVDFGDHALYAHEYAPADSDYYSETLTLIERMLGSWVCYLLDYRFDDRSRAAAEAAADLIARRWPCVIDDGFGPLMTERQWLSRHRSPVIRAATRAVRSARRNLLHVYQGLVGGD